MFIYSFDFNKKHVLKPKEKNNLLKIIASIQLKESDLKTDYSNYWKFEGIFEQFDCFKDCISEFLVLNELENSVKLVSSRPQFTNNVSMNMLLNLTSNMLNKNAINISDIDELNFFIKKAKLQFIVSENELSDLLKELFNNLEAYNKVVNNIKKNVRR